MHILNLEDPDCLPKTLRLDLKGCEADFSQYEFLDQIIDVPKVRRTVERIDEHCKNNMVVGYHYTRAIREDLVIDGLRPRSGAEIRGTFLARFGSRFSEPQLSEIKSVWDQSYDARMTKARDNRLFFNFTREALGSSGSEHLLQFYGGEQVYFYIHKIPEIGEILASIGEPFVVKCALTPAEVNTFIETPWGKIVASSYHRRVNAEAHQVDQDGYQFSPVPPDRIELLNLEH